MSELFRRSYHARWGDMDFNAHMRNTAYLDTAADVRMRYFDEHGFTMRDFERLRVGPVILRDELEYYRELRLLEGYSVTLELAGSSADWSRWLLRNGFYRDDGKRVARVESVGAWLDLDERRIRRPPDALVAVLEDCVRTSDWVELPSAVRGTDGA